MTYNHDDYMGYSRTCASLFARDLRVGDVVWVPSRSEFDPWRRMVEVVEVIGNGWLMTAEVGGNDHRFTPERDWISPDSLVYTARTVAETALAERA